MQRDELTSDVIYDYIGEYMEEHGYPPTIRNIANACQVATTTVWHNLNKLEAWGWLSREPGRPRSLRLLHVRKGGTKLEQN